uniref:Kinesin-like protein n=1 Tax=Gibberella zeae (strain ATCC MYA-4620 / CBS 123657 / FGSC 9075 / NRRL 31084 / PH-1) TaxID=229533 RepID=A0A098DX02_GIBZE
MTVPSFSATALWLLRLHQSYTNVVFETVFDPPEDNPVQKFGRSVVPSSKKVKDQVFAFDRVFDDNTTQSEVYEGTTRTLLDSVLDGYNATVFAYGATGCGKTHTITGTAQHPGIIFMTMQELFEKIDERSQDKVTELSLSYLEIYNETIRDLLVPGGGGKAGLTLREDSNAAVSVSGLTSHHPKDVQEVMDMIVQGNEYRTVSPTEANATSSRSHAVLQINVAQKDRSAGTNEPHTMATLSIIDLAGSERASVTKNRGERLVEGANINKSLLALGSCINALCDRRQKQHVPYRNSKLTRLLKFSLGGNCKTVMIVCVSPSSAHFDETQNTLRYANRAKNIQTKVTRNVFNVNRHVKDFLVKIDEQMALINELKAQQKNAEGMFFAKFRKQGEKRDALAREGVQRLRTAYEHSATERQERINNMKRLKGFERRIEVEKSDWERAIDTALSHALQQLHVADGADTGETDQLTREAELLKANFNREAYREVLEQDKAGDAAMTGFTAAGQVVKPDGSMPAVEVFSPRKRGTPKRKKSIAMHIKPVSAPVFMPENTPLSPTKGSPRRRKVMGASKKSISFTPVKMLKKKGGVRWRDDETEEGTLVDFSQTPQKFNSSPAMPSPEKDIVAPPMPSYLEPEESKIDESKVEDESSPRLEVPEMSSFGGAKPSRFQAGFLAKGARPSLAGGSPQAPNLSLRLGSVSPDVQRTPPLRSLDVTKSGNFSPSPSGLGIPRPIRHFNRVHDENNPPGSGSDSETSTIDARKLQTALRTAMKEKARRASILAGTGASSSKRVSSMGMLPERSAPRPSLSGPLASTTNGISRLRRGSAERRRSPPMACFSNDFTIDRALTQGQARRMNMSSTRASEVNGGSPQGSMTSGPARRITIGTGSGAAHRRQVSAGDTWR